METEIGDYLGEFVDELKVKNKDAYIDNVNAEMFKKMTKNFE